MSSPEALLDGLDEHQRAAALALSGPVCILAGAGTGKTRAITHRIAYGVATGAYPPKRVLALTFTARAASELRARLAALGADGVAARTFHAAALAQLNFFWPQVVGGGAPTVLESKGRVVAQAAESVGLRLDQAALRDVASEIEFRKSRAIGVEAYAALRRPPVAGLAPATMAGVMERYERLKDERRELDFEDVLLATAGMIAAEPAVAEAVREQYRWFVVDEYQDVSPAQQLLLDAWLGDRRDLCVVGDASQTVYSFAGAAPDYLLRFADRWQDAVVLRLERNHRSSAGVVALANALMTGRPGALRLTASRGGEPAEQAARVRRFATDAEEAGAIARDVAAMIRAGTPAAQIAVLYRIGAQAAPIEAALAAAGVAVRARGARRYFDQPVVRQAVMLLRAASVAGLAEPLFKSVGDALRELGHTHRPPPGPGEQRDRWELLDALATLAEQTSPGTTLAEFVADLAARAEAQHEPAMAAVTLATLHAAKGLEWPVVFIAGLAEGLLPIAYATTPEAVEEERRLLYVGITRARERLRLSYAATAPHRAGERPVSRFAADLTPESASGTSSADADRVPAAR